MPNETKKMPGEDKQMPAADKQTFNAIADNILRIKLALVQLESRAKEEKYAAIQTDLKELCLGTRNLLEHISKEINDNAFHHPDDVNYRIDTNKLTETLAWVEAQVKLMVDNPKKIDHNAWKEKLDKELPDALRYRLTDDFIQSAHKKRTDVHWVILALVVFLTIAILASGFMGIAIAAGAGTIGVLCVGIFGAVVGLGLSFVAAKESLIRLSKRALQKMKQDHDLVLGCKTPLLNTGKILLAINNIAQVNIQEEINIAREAKERAKAEKLAAAEKIAAANLENAQQEAAERKQRETAEKQALDTFYHIDENGNGPIVDALKARIARKNQLIDEVDNREVLTEQFNIQTLVNEQQKYLTSLEISYKIDIEILKYNHHWDTNAIDLHENADITLFQKLKNNRIYNPDAVAGVLHYLTHKNKLTYLNMIKEAVELKGQRLQEKQVKYNEPDYITRKIAKYAPNADNRRAVSAVLKEQNTANVLPADDIISYRDFQFRLFAQHSKKITAELHCKAMEIKRIQH